MMKKIFMMVVVLLVVAFHTLSVGAANVVYYDDFNKYEIGELASAPDIGGSYVVSRSHEIVERGRGNDKAFLMQKNGRILWSLPSEAKTGKYIVSMDFMFPNYQNATLFLINDGGSASFNDSVVRIMTTADGRILDENKTLVGTYETGIWHNIQLNIDLDEQTVTTRIGETTYQTTYSPITSYSPPVRAIGRIFSPYASDGGWYADNGEVAQIINDVLDEKIYETLSIIRNEREGLEIGTIPYSSFEMINDTYSDIKNLTRITA